VDPRLPSKKARGLTQECFDKLLSAFDSDRDRAGEIYEQIHFKLIKLFEWERSIFPEEHADETFDRVCRKLEEGVEIENLPNYCFGVAHYIVKEIRKDNERGKRVAIDDIDPPSQTFDFDDEDDQQLVECYKRCLLSLSDENRKLILKYYEEEKGAKIANRKKLADELGVNLAALRSRARHIRERIEECCNTCMKKIRS